MPLLAAVPVLSGIVLLVVLRWPASRAMALTGLLTAAVALWTWQVPAQHVAAATVEALFIAANVLFILFGALLLVAQLRAAGALARMRQWIGGLSPDQRIQAILVAWVMGGFFEGAAGFGTPAAITAPFLVALGFRPLQAVVLALVGDSNAVMFGAVGTPVVVGMAGALVGVEDSLAAAAAVGARAALYDTAFGYLMPAMLVLVLTVGEEGRAGWRSGRQAVPFAIVVGAAHLATAAAVARFLGPELPSLLGPAAGLAAALALLRLGWLVPSKPWRIAGEEDMAQQPPTRVGLARALSPYLLLIVLLAASRARQWPLGEWLRAATLSVEDLFGSGIDAALQPLWSPGFVFLLVALFCLPWFGMPRAALAASAKSAGAVALKALVALAASLVTVRIFLHSGTNAAALEAMPIVLAELMARAAGGAWPFFAPWLGALGAFIAGSATFSNMLFGGVQQAIAAAQALDARSILALQALGAAAGNMICVHNVVAAAAVVDLIGREGAIIRRTILPMTVYLLLLGALAMLL